MRQKSKGFDFKQFSIQHDRSAMKVGTDAVLLGAWVNISGARRILDVGTGCGIISLMLAQRTSTEIEIEGIEPDFESGQQAAENVRQSPWPEKVKIREITLQNYTASEKFDLIVSNPPYFLNSHLPPSSKRSKARHAHSLSYSELIDAAGQLLNKHGRLAVILPTIEGLHFQELAKSKNFYLNRQLAFFARYGKPQERWLLEFTSNQQNEIEKEVLILHSTGEAWSEAYVQLTREFYLNR